VERMVARLGEPRVPPAERAHLVNAVGALGAVSAGSVVDAYLHAAPELREAYRAAMRARASVPWSCCKPESRAKCRKWSRPQRSFSG